MKTKSGIAETLSSIFTRGKGVSTQAPNCEVSHPLTCGGTKALPPLLLQPALNHRLGGMTAGLGAEVEHLGGRGGT